ncbi:MAG: 7-cyano-7-deazaguanine synthase QueC [Thermodesulfobacteriota bacterium]
MFQSLQNMIMNNSAVVIVSGGIDSAVLCYKAVNDGLKIYPLTFIYGQKHSKEIDSAENICQNLSLEPNIIDISSIKKLLKGSALTDMDINIPNVSAETKNYNTLKTTVVPNRNAIFLSIAVGYGESLGVKRIYYGAHYSDRGIYPDCRKEFVEAFQIAERIANDNNELVIEAPFVDMEKSGIVKLGSSLGVPFEETWSCYAGLELHCGSCSSCRERKRAFVEAGVNDPTEYLK